MIQAGTRNGSACQPWDMVLSGLTSDNRSHLWSVSNFRHLPIHHIWQPACLFRLCHLGLEVFRGGMNEQQ